MSQQDLLSVQLYTVRDAIAEDLAAALTRVAEIGYRQVELFGFVDRVDEYRTLLPQTGLTAPSAHAHLIGGEQEKAFEAAAALGVGTLIDPHIDRARWQSTDDVRRIADDLNAAAALGRTFGITVGYHNHEFEFASRLDARTAFEVLADHLDDQVVLELDTYWAAVGGESDVPALLGRLGERVQLLHVKDGPITLDDAAQVAVGDGAMPVASILAAAPDALRVVELDGHDGDVFEALRRSRDFVRATEAAR